MTNEDQDRVDGPPRDLDAERALLGACMWSPAAIEHARSLLTHADYYQPAHRNIWTALITLWAQGAPVDPIAVRAELDRRGTLARSGGAPYLHTLYQAGAAVTDPTWHATQVRAQARLRRLDQVSIRLAQHARTGDTTRIDEILEQARADLAEAAEDLTADRDGPIDWADFWKRPAEPPDLLAGGVLAKARIAVIYSPGKTGKSLLAQEIAVSLATGAPILNDVGRAPLTVLYVDQEMTLDDWRDRFDDMHIGPDTDLSHLALYNLADWPPLDTAEGGQALARAADRHGADLVIIDTLSKVCAGEENSNDTFQAFYRHALVPLKRAGRAALVLDHTGKDISRGARGGTAKTDNVDLVWEMLTRGHELLSLKRTHARFRHPTEMLYLARKSDPLMHEIETVDERAEGVITVCLEQLRAWNIGRTESGRHVLDEFRKNGSKYTNDTFWEAWRRFRYENGWV